VEEAGIGGREKAVHWSRCVDPATYARLPTNLRAASRSPPHEATDPRIHLATLYLYATWTPQNKGPLSAIAYI
jgi:hypothetical protein